MQHEEIKDYYEHSYTEEELQTFPYDEARTRASVAPILQRLPQGASIVDIGCGVGYACAFLAERGYRVSGTDISEKALDIARRRLPGSEFTVAAEDGSLPHDDRSVDGVICLGVLEHIPQPERVLRECHRVLTDAGTAVFVVPNSRSPYFLFTPGTGQIYEQPRTRDGWRALFESTGFRVVSIGRDPGPKPSRDQSLVRNAKLLANKVLNRLPIWLTYQFVFELRKV